MYGNFNNNSQIFFEIDPLKTEYEFKLRVEEIHQNLKLHTIKIKHI